MVKQKKSGGAWYYEFMQHGKRYFGTCEGAKSQRQAEAFERTVKEKAKQANGLKSVKALLETFRDDLTGGKRISLAEAFELAEQKPRSRVPSKGHASTKRAIWGDFLAFMRGEHPDIENLIDVTDAHAQEYIALLQKSGRYEKTVSYSRGTGENVRTVTMQKSEGALSARTLHLYQMVCTEVFNLLAKDAGLQDNPFTSVRRAKPDAESREAFSPEELKIIFDNLDGFTRPLFMMAVWTGLREGDICTLKWNEVDLERHLITRKTRKTRTTVQIPISDQLYTMFLATERTESEYVFPKHAAMYLANSDGVSYRVKKFLEGLGIQTTRTPEGRTRAISVKDLHSCRHTFCYYAGLAGIPLAIVQAIVGHMSSEMTKHYQAHATLEDKRRGMERLSFFTQDALPAVVEEPERAELRSRIGSLPIELIREMLSLCKSGGRKK